MILVVPRFLEEHAHHCHIDSARVLSSIAVLSVIGETINLMTLAASLSRRILVDDATVTIENVERHLSLERNWRMRYEGSRRDRIAAFVSTLCICIVFVRCSFFPACRYLFVPLAEAVIFAVAASYLLSRTLVPTLIMWFERNHHKEARN